MHGGQTTTQSDHAMLWALTLLYVPMPVNVSLLHPFAGDLVQLGSTTVFRFNHPGEAAEMKDDPEVRICNDLLCQCEIYMYVCVYMQGMYFDVKL